VVRVGNIKRINIKLRVFDPGRFLVVRVGNLKRINIKLRVFDPGHLLVVRVGNLKRINIKLSVFDPGRLLVIRVGNLKCVRSKVRISRELKNPLFYSCNLGCLVKTFLAKTLLREKRPSEEKEYTQGYKYSVQYMFLTEIKLEMGYVPCIGYLFLG